jgi:type II secretory pathway component PulM
MRSAIALKWAQFWQQRNASERRTLSISAALISVMLCYFVIYEPVHKAFASARSQIKSQAQALEQIRALMKTRNAAAPTHSVSTGDASLTALVDQSVRAKNLQSGLKNITPVPPNRVRIELGGVNFDVLMAMLEQLELDHQVQVVELAIDTLGTSTVNAKVTFAK